MASDLVPEAEVCFLRGWPPGVLVLGGGVHTPGGREGGSAQLGWKGGEGVPINPPSHLFPRRGQKMQIVHHLPVKNRRPMISLHVVSGPWTSIVAALDKGRFNMAVCRRYNYIGAGTKHAPMGINNSTNELMGQQGGPPSNLAANSN